MAVDMSAGNISQEVPSYPSGRKHIKMAKMAVKKGPGAAGSTASSGGGTHTSQTPTNRASSAAVKKVAIRSKGSAAGRGVSGKNSGAQS